jgi:hypothetical protein
MLVLAGCMLQANDGLVWIDNHDVFGLGYQIDTPSTPLHATTAPRNQTQQISFDKITQQPFSTHSAHGAAQPGNAWPPASALIVRSREQDDTQGQLVR